MNTKKTPPLPTATRTLRWPGLMLGFALGGFFDGILLHQILQWHHLLSNVEGANDMRFQILADGLFHALMYLVALWALWALWKRRNAFNALGAGRLLCGSALLGFGLWHMVDGVLSHWLLGIHRIKMDSPNPLMWDLIWFFGFGLVPALAGWLLTRRDSGGGSADGRTAATALATAVLVGGPLAAMPPPAQSDGQVLVAFLPGVSASHAFRSLALVDARVVWVDQSGGVWAVTLQEPGAAWQLYRSGAMLVTQSAVGLGCVSWSRAI
jgi:uncharacterized membrane protein